MHSDPSDLSGQRAERCRRKYIHLTFETCPRQLSASRFTPSPQSISSAGVERQSEMAAVQRDRGGARRIAAGHAEELTNYSK